MYACTSRSDEALSLPVILHHCASIGQTQRGKAASTVSHTAHRSGDTDEDISDHERHARN